MARATTAHVDPHHFYNDQGRPGHAAVIKGADGVKIALKAGRNGSGDVATCMASTCIVSHGLRGDRIHDGQGAIAQLKASNGLNGGSSGLGRANGRFS